MAATSAQGPVALHDPRVPLDKLAQAERNAAWVKICRQIAHTLRNPETV